MAPTFDAPLFTRENVRGRSVPTGAGVVIAVTVLVVDAAVTVDDALGAEVDAATIVGRRPPWAPRSTPRRSAGGGWRCWPRSGSACSGCSTTWPAPGSPAASAATCGRSPGGG